MVVLLALVMPVKDGYEEELLKIQKVVLDLIQSGQMGAQRPGGRGGNLSQRGRLG